MKQTTLPKAIEWSLVYQEWKQILSHKAGNASIVSFSTKACWNNIYFTFPFILGEPYRIFRGHSMNQLKIKLIFFILQGNLQRGLGRSAKTTAFLRIYLVTLNCVLAFKMHCDYYLIILPINGCFSWSSDFGVKFRNWVFPF